MGKKVIISGKQELSDWIYEYHHLHYRYGFVAYLIINTAYLLLDSIYYPDFFYYCMIIRLAIALPVLLLPVILSFTGQYKKYFLITNTLAATVTPLTLLLLIFIISDSGSELSTVYYGGLIIQVMVIGLFIYEWKIAIFSASVIVAFYYFGGSFLFEFHARNFFHEELLLITSAAIIAILISYYYLAIKEKIIISENILKKEKHLIEEKIIELDNSNKLKNKLFSIIAHDLKSPFGAFLGLSQAMADELESLSQQEVRHYSVLINKSAGNLYKLVDNLLVWSRLQTNNIEFNPEICKISDAVEYSISILAEMASQKNISINFNNSNITVKADCNMLNSIFRNLLSNAVKFSNRGDSVYIEVKEPHDTNYYEISVRDYGIGIAAKDLGRIFDIDCPVCTNGTEGEPSTGLGLVLCREFVEKHGGRIWAESEAGKGSTFFFTLPSVETMQFEHFPQF